jgi:hypothetical protein
MAGKRGASNHAASTAATAATTAATAAAALAADAAAALAADATPALPADATPALPADATPALPAQASTTARAAEADTTTVPPSPLNKRPARACNSPKKSAKLVHVHGVVATTAVTTEKSAEAPSGTSYNMRQRVPPTQGSSSQNDVDNFGDEDALDKDDDSDKDLDKDDKDAAELTPKKVLPVIANLKRGKGRPPKPSSPQGNSNPYP